MADLVGMDDEFLGAINNMIAAAPGDISIYSGFRSPKRQNELWQGALKKYGSTEIARKWVAPPGRSYHGKGLAADLRYGGDDVRQWAHDNAGKFGLTFPLSNENWHIEPVGARGGAESPQQNQGVSVPVLDASQPQGERGGGLADLGLMGRALSDRNPGAQRGQMDLLEQDGGMTTDRFMSDLLAGKNPMRQMAMGKLFSLFL